MDKVKLSKDILKMVGGEENVDQVVHCMTRLRFNLHDDKIPNKQEIEKLDGVMGVMINGGQYQVIIGNEVAGVYTELVKHMSPTFTSKGETRSEDKPKKAKNPVSGVLDFISGMFTPILPAITGAGMIKGILAILVALNWIEATGSTYKIMAAIGDGAFYFLPILLAVSAARKLGSNMFIAAGIGAAILHPDITALLGGPEQATFLNIKVISAIYSSSVIPIVIAVWLASYVEKAIDKVTHASLKLLVVPTVTMLVMVPITLIAVGPIGVVAGNGLADGISWLFNNAGLFAGLLVGGTFSLLIITGMHYALVPIMIGSIATLGFDYMIPLMAAANLAQAGAAFGVSWKSRNSKTKTLAFSTGITAVMGITEPAMYGVNMKFKKPFISALIGAAIGGAFMSTFGTKAYVMGGLAGLPGIAMFIGPTLIYALIGLVISFVAAAIITYVIGFQEDEVEAVITEVVAEPAVDAKNVDISIELEASVANEEVFSPIVGEVKPLSAVPDPAFSEEIMGKGVAIEPSEGRVVAPVNGTVFSVSKSGHAIGIVSDKGAEMLIHIGIDTVKLKGQHFTPHVKAGAQVVVGDLLMEFDHIAIKQAGYEIITPVIITNIDQYNALEQNQVIEVKQGERLYSLKV